MEAIYACKLYRASSRKSKIQGAINDPLNSELVTQLKSYLDDEYQEIVDRQELKERADAIENITNDEVSNSRSESKSFHEGSSLGPSGGFGGPGTRPSLSEKFDMLLSDDGEPSSDGDTANTQDDFEGDSTDANEADDSLDLEDIEESTAIEGIDELNSSSKVDMSGQVKELLNSDEATKGINRILLKKNELWIHYSDDMNLNNVMGPVIEKLSNSGYDYLAFNRLARSENAIVFQVSCDDALHDEEGLDGI